MHDSNALPPLVVSGVSVVLEHRFAIVWPTGGVSSFPEWENLKVHLREETRSGNPDAAHVKVFVYTREWMEVPRPEA
jgi:hypothetical protein